MGDWLDQARQRLSENGFVPLDDAGKFQAVMRRSRIEMTKFGFSETFFTFAEFDTLTVRTVRRFSADAFANAVANKKILLPRGLFNSVWSFAVAVARDVDHDAVEMLRTEVPPKHWASAEMWAGYDRSRGKLYYLKKTPMWGAAYYAGFRKQIRRFLEGSQ